MNNEEKILTMLERLAEDVSGIKGEVAEIKGEVSGIKGEVATLKADAAELKADITNIKEDVAELNQKVDELDERSLRSAVLLENQVLPQLQLLYEGQVNLQQTLAPKEQVEVLEDEVNTIRSVVKSMSSRLAALEKAQ